MVGWMMGPPATTAPLVSLTTWSKRKEKPPKAGDQYCTELPARRSNDASGLAAMRPDCVVVLGTWNPGLPGIAVRSKTNPARSGFTGSGMYLYGVAPCPMQT